MIEDTVYLSELYDCYSTLLTDIQREYFEDYYFQNLTCQEIGDNKGVTRNAVNKQLKDATLKLKMYEQKLKLNKKYKRIEELSVNIDNQELIEEIKRIIWE